MRSTRQEVQQQLAEQGASLPGVAEATAIYEAAQRGIVQVVTTKPSIGFATGGNSPAGQ